MSRFLKRPDTCNNKNQSTVASSRCHMSFVYRSKVTPANGGGRSLRTPEAEGAMETRTTESSTTPRRVCLLPWLPYYRDSTSTSFPTINVQEYI